MPITIVNISIKDFLFDNTIEESGTFFGIGTKFRDVAMKILNKHLKPCGIDIDYDPQNFLLLTMFSSGSVIELDDLSYKQFEALERAEKEFQVAIKSDYEVVMETSLEQLPTLLGDELDEEGSLLLVSRLKDPIRKIREFANSSETTEEFVSKIKRFNSNIRR